MSSPLESMALDKHSEEEVARVLFRIGNFMETRAKQHTLVQDQLLRVERKAGLSAEEQHTIKQAKEAALAKQRAMLATMRRGLQTRKSEGRMPLASKTESFNRGNEEKTGTGLKEKRIEEEKGFVLQDPLKWRGRRTESYP